MSNEGRPRPSAWFSSDRRVRDALDAYLDAPGEETEATLLQVAPEGKEEWLVAFAEALAEFPGSACYDALREAQDRDAAQDRGEAPPSTGVPARRAGSRTHHRPSPVTRPLSRFAWRPAGTVVTVAVVLVVLVAAILTVTLSGRSPRHVGINLPAAPAAWRLAGVIDQATWQTTASSGSAVTVSCPVAMTCYAEKPGVSEGGTVVEITTDGGATWRASPLPPGTRVTSALSCPTAERCLAGGHTSVSAGSGDLSSILATTDGGATWSVEPLPAGVAEITNLACTSISECVGAGYGPVPAAGFQGPPVAVVTTDGGVVWTVVALPGPFVPSSPGGLACSTARSCVVVGTTSSETTVVGSSTGEGSAAYTTNGGQTWSLAVVPPTVARVRAASCSGAHCVALGDGPSTGSLPLPYGPSEALTSSDGGRSWSLVGPVDSVPALLSSISCPTTADCWAAGRLATSRSGVIVVTHDAGATWTTAALPTTPSPAQQRATGLSQLDVENVSSVSCPTPGTCVALGAQVSLNPTEQQIALRTDGP